MEAATTIRKLFAGNRILVPDYHHAYSWNSETNSSMAPKEVNTFLSDLEEYNRNSTESKYYFGHFLFEEKAENEFGVIDGQQRLTTIVIFLSALFSRLKTLRRLSDVEEIYFEDLIKRKSTYRFATYKYDNELFKDYVVDQITNNKSGLVTESAKRIVHAFDFFYDKLADKDDAYLVQMLETVQGASCTTHRVRGELEAIRMFALLNNRGKKASNLQVVKAHWS